MSRFVFDYKQFLFSVCEKQYSNFVCEYLARPVMVNIVCVNDFKICVSKVVCTKAHINKQKIVSRFPSVKIVGEAFVTERSAIK